VLRSTWESCNIMLDDCNYLKLNYKITLSNDGKYRFISIVLRAGKFVIGNPDAISILGLIEGEAEKIIKSLLDIKIKNNSDIIIYSIPEIDLDELFECCFEHILGGNLDDARMNKHKNIIERTALSIPFANECFDGNVGFLSYLGKNNGLLFWRDFESMKTRSLIVDYSMYIKIWEEFIAHANCQSI